MILIAPPLPDWVLLRDRSLSKKDDTDFQAYRLLFDIFHEGYS